MKFKLIVIFIFIPFIFWGQLTEESYYFDENGYTLDSTNASKVYILNKIMDKTYILIKKAKYNDENEWSYPYKYEEIRLSYSDSVMYHRIITKACCDRKNYHDDNESKIFYNKVDSLYYIKIFDEKNNLIQEGKSLFVFPHIWVDSLKTYYYNGNIKTITIFKNGKQTEKLFFTRNSKIIDYNDKRIIQPDTLPKTLDNNTDIEKTIVKYITKNYEYPSKAKENFIMGPVYVSFFITTEGKVECVEIIYGSHPLWDESIENLFYGLPEFKPAIKDGKEVNYRNIIPVKHFID